MATVAVLKMQRFVNKSSKSYDFRPLAFSSIKLMGDKEKSKELLNKINQIHFV